MKEMHAYMHNHNSVILWCKATQEYSIPVSFLPLFSAPYFVLPYEMDATVKWRSRFIFSFKKAKTKQKYTMAKKLKNVINKKWLSLLSSVSLCIVFSFAGKAEISYNTDIKSTKLFLS